MKAYYHGSVIMFLYYFLVYLSVFSICIIPVEQVVFACEKVHIAIDKTSRKSKYIPYSSNTGSISTKLSSFNSPVFKPLPTVNHRSWQAFAQASVNSTALPSNANSFHGEANASVDPRTGSVSFGMVVASTLYDQGQSKRDLMLSYAGNSLAHGTGRLGLGSHWTFNVGTEHPSFSEVLGHKTTDITTGDGHSFTMVSDRNKQGQIYWHPLRHKLGDVTITGEPGDWTIATASGTREHLQYGYEDWEEGHDGQRVWFYYDRNGPDDITRRLLYVCSHPLTLTQVEGVDNACKNEGVRITYLGSKVTVHGQQDIVLHLGQVRGENTVQFVSMPSFNSKSVAGGNKPSLMRFDYDEQGSYPQLLKTVTEPSGKSSTFLYNDESDRSTSEPQGLPEGLSQGHLPVVTEEITTPAPVNSQVIPTRKVWYQYSGGPSDQHNFTGYLSGISNEPGKDNLFDRADDYTYTVSKDNGLTTTTTIYNRYHLPLTVSQADDLRHSLIARNDVTYSPWKGTTFSELPSTYSLPKQTTKTLYALTRDGPDSAVFPAKVLQQKAYDNNGQMIWQQDAYGRQTFIQYCPLQGDSHCPKMDPDWPQVTLPEKVIQLPSRQTPAGSRPFVSFATTGHQSCGVEVEFNYTVIPVAQKYRVRIKKYQQLLKRQWHTVRQLWSSAHHSRTNGLTSSKLFSQSRFSHEVGEDNSGQAGSWQVVTKTVGTVSPGVITDIKPGDALPELSPSQLITGTHFQYNTDQSSLTYGQLIGLSVSKYNQPAVLATGQSQLAGSGQPEQVSFNVIHHINNRLHTFTTDIEVAQKQPPSDIHNINRLLAAGDGSLSLGKTVYSLTSGVKLSNDDPLKTLHIDWTYDIWQRPVKEVITPETGGLAQTTHWTYIFNSKEAATVTTLPGGTQNKVVYAGGGKNQVILSDWHRSKAQASAPMTGTSNWIQDSAMTYTATGNLSSKTTFHAADHNGKTIGLTSHYGYDLLNRPVWKKSADGTISVQARNDSQMLLMSYQVATGRDNRGEKLAPDLSVVQSNTIGKPVAEYTFALAPDVKVNGKPLYTPQLKKTLIALESQLISAKSLKTVQSYGLLPPGGKNGLFAFVNEAIKAKAWLSESATEYDGNGRRTEQTLPNGTQIHWQWQHGNLVSTTTPNGSMIHDSFDIQGNKTSRCVQPVGQAVCHILGSRGYDDEGNLAWQTDEYGNTNRYTYDADGRLLSMTTAATKTEKSHQFTFTYNSFAITSASVDGVTFVIYTYDPSTWQITDKEDVISHLHYDYDPDTGFLIKVTRSAPITLKSPPRIDYPTGTESVAYDRYGAPVSLKDLAGNTYSAIHDELGRVLQSQVTLPGSTQPTLLSSVTYAPYFNRPAMSTNGVGVVRRFIYNDLGALESTVDERDNVILQQLSYTYDVKTHNITTLTRTEKNNSATQTYTYDKNTNSLTDMTCSVTGKLGTASILCPEDTDVSGSNLTTPSIITSQHYTFDQWNNIKTVNETLVTSAGKNTSKTTHYTYAGPSESRSDDYDPHRMIAFSTEWATNASNFNARPKMITYDGSGRITQDADGNTLHYNAFGQQDSFTNHKTGEKTLYRYDSAGHQVVEQPFNARGKALQPPLYMVYQGNNIIEQVQSDVHGTMHNSVELGGVAHSEDGVINRWYLHDYKGDVLVTLNGSGQSVSDHVYSPYGMDDNLSDSRAQALPEKFKLTTQNNWWKSHQPGFDNQMSDPATGYQFLGGGYRSYNPVYRHFMSHDSYSPFKKIDGYGFGDNNPVMNTDPTGHMPKWLGYALGGLSIAMSVVSAVLLPVVAVGAASAAGATAAGIASGVGSGIAMAVGTASGGLQIAGTALPKNKNLAIANQAFGIANGVVAFGMGFAIGFSGVASAASAVTGAEKLTSSMIITSGVSGSLSGLTGEAGSVIGMGMTVNPGLADKAGFATAVNVLGDVSMALMTVSVESGLGAGIGLFARRGESSVKEVVTTPEEKPLKTPCVDKIRTLRKLEGGNHREVYTDGTRVYKLTGPPRGVKVPPAESAKPYLMNLARIVPDLEAERLNLLYKSSKFYGGRYARYATTRVYVDVHSGFVVTDAPFIPGEYPESYDEEVAPEYSRIRMRHVYVHSEKKASSFVVYQGTTDILPVNATDFSLLYFN